MSKVTIYGKADCPHTARARRHYAAQGAQYVDVKADAEALERMLVLSRRRRAVPVIVEDGDVSVGFDGGI